LIDSLMHAITQRVADYGMPLQIHTGPLDCVQVLDGFPPTYPHPGGLRSLALAYPSARLDVLHGGFPWCGDLGALARTCPNVSINMAWLPVISPSATARALREWLESVPLGKLIAFGGDYHFPEGTYAHARITREVVASTLSLAVE